MARVPVVHLNHRTLVASLKESAPKVVNLPPKKKTTLNSRVLILGGTGRVGGSTAIALSKLCPDLRLLVAGRNREKGASLVATLGENSDFVEVDLDNVETLEAALNDVDLVVHAAGPFQQTEKCKVLEAAISTQTAYLDVCDDTNYAWRAKSFHEKAVAANIPAITTGGIYPGVSNVMAAELVRNARSESKEEPEKLSYETVPGLLFPVKLKEKVTQSLGYVVRGAAESLKEGSLHYEVKNLGTGGAGPTILATSFLLLGEEVVAYNQGEKIKLKPYSGMLNIDFGNGIRKRDVYLLNLPEVSTTHEILGVPSVSARFGTAPFFWNWGMEAMTRLVPAETLRDKAKVQKLVQLFDPVVRAIDGIAGERVSMRVDLECSNGRHTVGIFSHKRLSVSVGTSTAAFALAILEGSTQPGVWFPEEPEGIAVEARELLLKRAAEGTFNFAMNKSPWMVESNPKEFGLGIYV